MTFQAEHHEVLKMQKRLQNPFLFKLFLFKSLPSGWFWRFRLKTITTAYTEVELPYRWSTKNPFQSTYFAAQTGAGEFATGALAMLILSGFDAPVSMLVTTVKAEFVKKAVGVTTFTCNDGDGLRATIEKAFATGEGHEFTATAEGRSEAGEVVSKVWITWSFKAKKR